jgi:hypothetical protein
MEILGKVWQAWLRIGQAIGDFIGRIVLTIFYFTLFAPFGLSVRLLGDPLAIRLGGEKVQWLERTTRDHTLINVRRMS